MLDIKNNSKDTDAIILRGICAAIQSMAMPGFGNLQSMLVKFGYRLEKI